MLNANPTQPHTAQGLLAEPHRRRRGWHRRDCGPNELYIVYIVLFFYIVLFGCHRPAGSSPGAMGSTPSSAGPVRWAIGRAVPEHRDGLSGGVVHVSQHWGGTSW